MKKYYHSAVSYYEQNERKIDIWFFILGFLFDVFTLSKVDDLFSIAQQVLYLLIIGLILYYDFLESVQLFTPSPRVAKIWTYRTPIMHFFLGSLLSVYSLFFIISSSFFSSFVFIFTLVGIMVGNELKVIQESKVNLKIALYIVCVFSFFSTLWPVILGFVGWVPFLLSLASTLGTLYFIYKNIQIEFKDTKVLFRKLLAPALAVTGLFFVFYLMHWIPPVPLAVNKIGVYHKIEKFEGKYLLYTEKGWWEFWKNGDQDFLAEPGDQIILFAQIYAPSRFNDSIILHWMYKDVKGHWADADSIPFKISGGREKGFRGYASKQNYSEGEWQVRVETTDGREIGRLYFAVTKTPTVNPNRIFTSESY